MSSPLTGSQALGGCTRSSTNLPEDRNPQDKIGANAQLDSALGRLLAIVENYPQLKSNENFLRLQDELAGTENRIAVATNIAAREFLALGDS